MYYVKEARLKRLPFLHSYENVEKIKLERQSEIRLVCQ